MAIKKEKAKSVLHMATSPAGVGVMGFLFCDFFWIRHHEPEVDCYHFGDRHRANMCGSKADLSEGDQDA